MICPGIQVPAKLSLNSIEWLLATDANGNKVIALSPDDYETLGKNMASISAYIQKQKTVADYYARCIKTFNEAEKNVGQ